MYPAQLAMPIGEVMFSQRSIRHFRPDPVPIDMFDIPKTVTFHFCVPLGYPERGFGPTVRKPTSETTYLNRWGGAVPWS
jgi:nitroreductase